MNSINKNTNCQWAGFKSTNILKYKSMGSNKYYCNLFILRMIPTFFQSLEVSYLHKRTNIFLRVSSERNRICFDKLQ